MGIGIYLDMKMSVLRNKAAKIKQLLREKSNILLPIILVVIFSIYFAFVIIKYPLLGISVKEIDNDVVISGIKESSWAINQPIQIGDIIKEINGKDPSEYSTIKWYQRVEKADTLTILRDNHELQEFHIHYKHFDIQNIVYFLLPLFFSSLTIFLSSFLIKKKDKTSTILIYFLLSIGLGYLSTSASIRGDLLGYVTSSITLFGSLVLFVHFLQKYFSRFNLFFVKEASIVHLYIFYFSILFVDIILYFSTYKSNIFNFELTVFFLLVVYIIFLLSRFLLKYNNTEFSNIIKTLCVIFTLAFSPFTLFYVLPTLFFGKALLSAEISALFMIIIPIGLVYLSLSEKMLDVEFFLSRLRYYSLLSFPFSLLFDLIINIVSTHHMSTRLNIIIILFLFIFTTLFLYFKEFIDYKLKFHLFSSKSTIEANLYSFLYKARCETKINGLMCKVMDEIKTNINIREIFCLKLLKKDNDTICILENECSMSPLLKLDLENMKWNKYLIGSLLDLENSYALVIEGDLQTKSVIIFNISKVNMNLNIDERKWLEALAFFTSVIIENFQLIDGLIKKMEGFKNEKILNKKDHPHWLTKILFSLSEKERTNLSIDLHDSVLQEQLLLLRETEKMINKVTDSFIKNDLVKFKEMILDNIHLIRETCNELRPPLLDDLGLMQSVQSFIDQTRLRCDFLITAELDISIKVSCKECQLVLYRVIQELLNNAMKHSLALNVHLSIYQKNNILFLFYEDDGKGFDMKKLNEGFKTMGLFGMKERIKSIGGKIKIISGKGQGMKVSIEVKTGGVEK